MNKYCSCEDIDKSRMWFKGDNSVSHDAKRDDVSAPRTTTPDVDINDDNVSALEDYNNK